jgi:hypothetical protein
MARAAAAKPTVVRPHAHPSSAGIGTMTANTKCRTCEMATSSAAHLGTTRPR